MREKNTKSQVTVAMATQPCRADVYVNAVYELLPQCDRLCICFNGFDKIPDNLPKSSKIVAICANDINGIKDLGCNNKMYWLGDFPGYYATVDDDIDYPANYISELKRFVDQYSKRAICSFHGHVYNDVQDGKINFRNRTVYAFHTTHDTYNCHRLGMGVAMCYPSAIGITKDIFLSKPKNFGDDEVTAMFAQEHSIPLYCVSNSNVRLIENMKISRDQKTALSTNVSSQRKREGYLESYTDWRLFNIKRKILVMSAGTSNLEYQYSLTNKIKQSYCDKFGYDYKFIDINDTVKKSFHARKQLILDHLDKYDWVMWIDCDAWFNDFSKSLDVVINNTDKSLIVSRDEGVIDDEKYWHSCYINSGVLLFRSNDISRSIIDRWQNCPADAQKWMSQATTLNDQPYLSIITLFDKFVHDNTLVLQPNEFNKFIKLGYSKSSFIIHLPGKKDDHAYKQQFIDICNDWIKNHLK